ncbi:MAG: PorT family protein [Rikenellaceae bacterium]|nr:PorT family protein [Rikenellaceae bacterium]
MRKLFLLGSMVALALLAALPAAAQHYIGVRGGYGGGSARFEPKRETFLTWGMYSGGLSWKYYSPEKYVGAVEVDLEMLQQGYAYDLRKDGDSSYRRSINSVTLPVIWQPHFYLFRRSMRVFLNLGVTFSYNFNSRYEYVSKMNGVYEEGKYDMELIRDNRWGYGLVGGFGLSVLIGRVEAAFEGRYYFGYADILRNPNKYPGNPQRSPLDKINISMGLYYRLGKGGILAPLSKRAAAKEQERLEARMWAEEERRAAREAREEGDVEEEAVAAPASGTVSDPVPGQGGRRARKRERAQHELKPAGAPVPDAGADSESDGRGPKTHNE